MKLSKSLSSDRKMQKRRVRASKEQQLPLTMADVSKINNKPSSFAKSRKGSNNSSTLVTCGLFVLVIVMVWILLTTKFDYAADNLSTSIESGLSKASGASLSKYNSLQSALSQSNLVGLYFAASWCSMSTPVTKKLEELFSNEDSMQSRVLSEKYPASPGEKKDFALVYVSSDESEERMTDYSRWNWINVPFDSPDRNNLKRHFRTCAEIEMKELGIEVRRFHIPTLIIIDSKTQGVLTTNGVDELQEYGKNVLDHWLALQSLTRGLENKYESM